MERFTKLAFAVAILQTLATAEEESIIDLTKAVVLEDHLNIGTDTPTGEAWINRNFKSLIYT